MKTAIIIPARYASTRLPGKPLLRATGKYLVQHVYERALAARCAGRVIIATDDRRVAAAVRTFGGEFVLTSRQHRSGTDRVAEVAAGLDSDVIVNLQGDEPLVDPAAIDRLPELLQTDRDAVVATLATPLRSADDWHDPNCVKVVRDDQGRALYFSRSPIPFVRDGVPDLAQIPPSFFQHVGLYAYRREFLLRLAAMPTHALEELEKLEQLRVLATGGAIQVGVIPSAARGVDTFEDYERFRRLYRSRPGLRAA